METSEPALSKAGTTQANEAQDSNNHNKEKEVKNVEIENKIDMEEENKHEIENKQDNVDTTYYGQMKTVGEKALFVVDFLGEVFAEFFGMTQSRYQNVIDAYNRQKRWEREEKRKQKLAKKRYLEEMEKAKAANKYAEDNLENILPPNSISLDVRNTIDLENEEEHTTEKKNVDVNTTEKKTQENEKEIDFPMPDPKLVEDQNVD
ncbi:hypothetical protein RFI_07739 [Reticulomyxa filosa]|uniref:Uncharacterized protein n=1 Tax=Reticulomyxa filosa TaxID=46433 RepID=X6NVU9_RETFI|nr:hypothetical protein RFI_07739 [Reticulomyxa filosa]|eukprot:ETO29382.1 hypothetical protein RFI_07739 [Reticulomyxa filosa]